MIPRKNLQIIGIKDIFFICGQFIKTIIIFVIRTDGDGIDHGIVHVVHRRPVHGTYIIDIQTSRFTGTAGDLVAVHVRRTALDNNEIEKASPGRIFERMFFADFDVGIGINATDICLHIFPARPVNTGVLRRRFYRFSRRIYRRRSEMETFCRIRIGRFIPICNIRHQPEIGRPFGRIDPHTDTRGSPFDYDVFTGIYQHLVGIVGPRNIGIVIMKFQRIIVETHFARFRIYPLRIHIVSAVSGRRQCTDRPIIAHFSIKRPRIVITVPSVRGFVPAIAVACTADEIAACQA